MTKLIIPNLRPNAVIRPRLLVRLDSSSNCNLTLVSAPAGFGKTSLLSTWSRQTNLPVAWLTLDESDNSLTRFLGYLVAALQTIHPLVGQSLLEILNAGQSPTHETLMIPLINDLARIPSHLGVVLDDYHLINHPELHQTLEYFIEHLPPQVRLILATRSDPPIPLSRLRGRGQLAEIRTADLRFTRSECETLLNATRQLNLSQEQVDALQQRTEGWAAGLQMACLSIQTLNPTQVANFIINLTSSNRFILDYLTDEVLNQQSPERQTFLLKTSILESLTGPLCDFITDQSTSQAWLAELEAENLFLFPLDEERRWYRFHPLFADLLRKRLANQHSQVVPELHLRASQWYEQQGWIPQAVSHVLESGNLSRAAGLIAAHILEVIFQGDFLLAAQWLAQLPTEILQNQPTLRLAQAWTLVLPGKWDQAEEIIHEIEALSPASISESRADQALLTIPALMAPHFSALQAVLARARSQTTQMQFNLVQQALLDLPQGETSLRGLLEMRLGFCYLDFGEEETAEQILRKAENLGWQNKSFLTAITAGYVRFVIARRSGRFRQAAQICQDALGKLEIIAQETGRMPPIGGLPLVGLGTILLEWNDLSAAEQALLRGLRLLDTVGFYQEAEIQVKGHYALARLRLANQADQALPDLKQVASFGKLEVIRYAAALQARLQLLEHSKGRKPTLPAILHAWAEKQQISFKPCPNNDWDIFEQLTYIRYWIAQSMPPEAGRTPPEQIMAMLESCLLHLESILAFLEQRGWVDIAVDAWILKALLHQSLGREEPALRALEKAILRAEPEGILRPFLDEGTGLLHLLYQAAGRGIRPQFTHKLLAQLEIAPQPSTPVTLNEWVMPLTRRETEVLKAIAAGLSNQEISQNLTISLGTTKRHIANIFTKLDCHTRLQAVNRARRLGILPEEPAVS